MSNKTNPISSPSDIPHSNEIVPAEDSKPPSSSTNPINQSHSTSTSDAIHDTSLENQLAKNKMHCLLQLFQFWKNNGKPNDNKSRVNEKPNKHDNKDWLSESIRKQLQSIQKETDKSINSFSKINGQIEYWSNRFDKLIEQGSDGMNTYQEILKNVKKLKKRITVLPKQEAHDDDDPSIIHPRSEEATAVPEKIRNILNDLEKSEEFKEFDARYRELDVELKLCLLCFSVFPENARIKKRVMKYWWIGEGFVPPVHSSGEKTAEQFADEFFDRLVSEGFIEPVREKRRPGVDVCTMHPFVRTMVIALARRVDFLDFDPDWNATVDYKLSLRSCLKAEGLTNIKELRKLRALFNVSDTILEFNPEWFSKMRNVNVIYLGRWETSTIHHIEVEYTIRSEKLLEGLKNLKLLRLLSLHGISRITKLPDSILKLTNLVILDLRACHNLEVIPDKIELLHNLTHLDISECYLLDHMPKGIANLSKLQVLGGFVVGCSSNEENACTVIDLQKLKNLRKLSIHTSVYNFPSRYELLALHQFKMLSKLTIAWGRGARRDAKQLHTKSKEKEDGINNDQKEEEEEEEANKESQSQRILSRLLNNSGAPVQALPSELFLPSKLIKLDIQCFPRTKTPEWLRASNLKNLKKLYIRGGKFPFPDLQFQDDQWQVEELHLKYLTDLEMEWWELQRLFPKLNYLEKVNCPKLTFIPCDKDGVWMKRIVE